MRLWPWGSRPDRGVDGRSGALTAAEERSYSDILTAALEAQATAGTPSAVELGMTEAAAGIIGRCFAAAEVSGDRFGVVTRGTLEIIGRELVRRGEMVFVLEGPPMMLLPAGNWNVHGTEPVSTWFYRVDTFGPDSTRTRWIPSDGIVHARVNCAPERPYEGRSPIAVARATSTTAANAEKSAGAEAKMPAGRIAPVPSPDKIIRSAYKARLEKGGVTVVEAAANPVQAAGQEPARRWEPAPIHPDPTQGHVQLRREAAQDVLSACGIPPALFDARADGTTRRESYRQLVFTTLEPWGRIVAEELSRKLDSDIALSFAALHGADLATRGRALRQLVDAGVPLAEALAITGLDQGDM